MRTLALIPPLLLVSLAASAFRLDPMVVEFTPEGSGSSRVFKVENNGQERIAVQFKVTTRAVDVKGRETRETSNEFSIYPEQISLGPNDSRNVRVTYQGPKTLSSEKAFRLIASQLPVDFKGDRKKAQINFLFQYVASVYVRPEGAHPRLEIASVHSEGGRRVKVLLANRGGAHRLLKGVRVRLLDDGGKAVGVRDSSFADWSGENLLAGAEREFWLETAEPLATGAKLKAELAVSESP